MISTWLAFLVGFVSIANFSINPALLNTFRLSDILCLVLAVLAIIRILMLSVPKYPFVITSLTLFYLGLWAVFGFIINDMSTVYAAGRLSAGIMAALYLTMLWGRDAGWITPLLAGLAVGGGVVTLITLGQHLELHPVFGVFKPASAKIWWVLDRVRSTGIWEHPNGLTHSSMIGASASLGLLVTKRYYVFGAGLFLFITAGLYQATATRSGLVIATGLLVVAFLLIKRLDVKVAWAIAAIIALVFLPILLPGFFVDRLLDLSGRPLAGNAAERVSTAFDTFFFSLQRPFGYGFSGRTELLTQSFGFSASHNSFLSIAMSFGLLPTALLIVGFFKAIKKLWKTGGDSLALLFPVLSILLSFFFEDSIYSTTFTTLVPILLMLSVFAVGNDNRISELKGNVVTGS